MSKIIIDNEKCVHCGACTAVCNVDSLSMDKSDWTLELNSNTCIYCKLCVSACPTRAIKVYTYGDENV